MGSSQREEIVDQAIQKVVTQIEAMDDRDQHQLFLSSLLSQLESLKSDGKNMEPNSLPQSKSEEGAVDSSNGLAARPSKEEEKPVEEERGEEDGGTESALVEEVVKELKALKRQNLVTHCLLSAMILVTVVWQFSEASLILKVHDGLSHPFRSFGSMLSGFLGGRKMENLLEPDKHKSSSKHQTGDIVSPVPSLNVPELPNVEFGLNGQS